MKIIKNNVKPEITATVTCMYCTSILEVTPSDLTEYVNTFPPDFKGTHYGFWCPCCEQYAYVADNNALTAGFIDKVKVYKSRFR